jgi:DNA-binding transcriptional LysR family regulator
MHVNNVQAPFMQKLSELRDRKFDLIVSRMEVSPARYNLLGDDLHVERLFDDRLVVAAGLDSRWAGRRKIELAELIGEPWILPASGFWGRDGVADAFQAAGLEPPKISVVTLSVPLRIDLIVTGKFLSAIPKSLAERYSLKILPIEFKLRPWSVVIAMLKNRTLGPVVQRFIECCRDVPKSVGKSSAGRMAHGKPNAS